MTLFRNYLRLWQDMLTDRRLYQPLAGLVIIAFCAMAFATDDPTNEQDLNATTSPGGCGPCDEEKPCPCEPGPEAATHPILLWRGAVLENEVDAYLPGIGKEFMHSRSYSSMSGAASNSAEAPNWIQGNRWAGGAISRMLVRGVNDKTNTNPDTLDLILNAADMRPFTRRTLVDTETDYNYFDCDDSEYLTLFHNTADGVYELTNAHSGAVWEFSDFGSGQGAGQRGLTKARLDRQGNKVDYIYGGSGDEKNRISSVTTSQGWEVDYTYAVGTANIGMITQVDVKDAASNGNVMQRVRYTYKGDANLTLHSDISSNATDGDLLMVEILKMGSDPSKWGTNPADADFADHDAYMYRYEGGSRIKAVWLPDAAERAISAIGAVTNPVDLLNQSDAAVSTYRSRSFTYYTGDTSTASITTPWTANEDLNTTYGLAERAETELAGSGGSQETLYRVKSETIYTGQGGVTKTYAYMQLNDPGAGTATLDEVRWVTIEDTEDSTGAERYRKIYAMNEEGILLREVFIDNPTSSPRYWCTSHLIGTSGFARNKVLEKRLPSAHTGVDTAAELKKFLDPTTATNDADTLNDASGRVSVTDYETSTYDNANGTFTMTQGIKQGENGATHWLGYTHFQKFDGTTDSDTPRFLPVESYLERDFGTTDMPVPQSATAGAGEFKPEADDVTTIAYTFYATDEQVVKTKTTTLPSAETTENGSDVRTVMRQYLDSIGRVRWTKDGEGNVTYVSYNPDTGGVAYVMRDVDTDNLPGDITNGDNQGTSGEDIYWEAWSGTLPAEFANTDNGNEQLVTKTQYDTLARPRKVIDAEGLGTYIAYGSNETRIYPAWDDAADEPLLPIVVTKTDDVGRVVERFAMDPSGVTIGLSGGEPTGLDTGVTQADYVSWSKSNYNDYFQLEHTDRYHKIPDTGDGTAGTNFYRDRYTYDDEGRFEYSIKHVSGTTAASAVEQVSKVEYDRLSRAIRVYSGVSDTGHNADTGGDPTDFPLVALTYYDEATPGSAAPADNPEVESGVGDSLVTSRISFYKFDSAETRDVDEDYYLQSVYHRNWRQQMRGMEIQAKNGAGAESSQTPQAVVDVDNLGRVIASATYDSALTWSTVTGDVDYASAVATDRRTLSKNYYDLLGQNYQSESFEVVASTGATTNKIVSDRYYDRNGFLVAGTSSGSGGFEIAYDGALRQFQSRSVTEIEASYTSGSYDYQAPAPVPGLGTGTIAGSGGDDNVLTISHRVLNDIGQVLESIALEADHDDTDGLDLTNKDDFVQSAVHYYFDDAHRITDVVNLGTSNDNFVYNALTTRAGTVPTRSDTKLVTSYSYDSASRLLESTDPKALKSRRGYDDLSRAVYSVSNYDNFNFDTEANTGGAGSDDRVTKYVFNALNQVTDQVALDPDGDGNLSDNQTTTYTYGDDVLAGVMVEIEMPDSTGASDVVARTYHLDGRIDTQTDQRGTVLTHAYDALRRMEARTVTTLGGDTDGDVRAITYQRDALGLITAVTSHGNATTDPTDTTDIVNQIKYTYHDHLGLHKEQQEHDGAVDGSTLEVVYAYDTTASGGVFTKGLRRSYVEYPNGRQVHTTYGTANSIDDKLSRAAGLADEDGTTADTAGDAITSYTWTGSGRLALKSLEIPGVDLNRITPEANGSGPSVAGLNGLDRFGRIVEHTWIDNKGTGGTTDDTEHLHIAHGYDRNSNRLYDDRKDSPSYSKVFTHDDLNRISSYVQGHIESDQSGIKANWITGGADYELNQLGSILSVDPSNETDGQVQKFEYNDANEPTAIEYDGEHQKESFFIDYFDDSSTEANWELPAGSSDGFEIDDSGTGSATSVVGIADELAFSITQDTYDGLLEAEACVILLWKDSTDIGLVAFEGDMYPPGGQSHAQGTEVGFVFGYKSPNDYYIAVGQTSGLGNVYHIHKANPTDTFTTKTYIGSCSGFSANSRLSTKALRRAFGGNAIPTGRIGIWSNDEDATIEEVQAYNAAGAPKWHGRWRYSEAAQAGKGQRIDNSGEYLRIRHRNTLGNNAHNDYAAALIDGMTVEKFQITFRAEFINRYARPMLRFAYQGDDDFVQVGTKGDGKYIYADHVEDDDTTGLTMSIEDSSALPGIGDGDEAWYRYESDGSTITGYCIEQKTAPTQTQWDNQDPFVEFGSIPNSGRGGIGLGTRGEGGIEFDYITLKSDPDGDGTYDIIELYESFDNDGDNFRDMQPEHDAAGNLTYDGLRYYTYDAFNRLVKVENAFKDPGYTPAGGSAGDLAIGSTIAEYAYDAQSRRIRKDTYIGGELDNVEHFYCIGDTLVETRNGSNQVIQQHVWHSLARDYIDSLAEVSNNTNPGVDDSCDQRLFTLQDQQFNVLALVDDAGDVVERYEYGLYGERTVMNKTYVVLHESAYNMNCGFQGLYHDTETGLVYNRARMLNSRLGRFNQRDPLGYPDGMNTYAAYHVLYGGLDPSGMAMNFNGHSTSDLRQTHGHMIRRERELVRNGHTERARRLASLRAEIYDEIRRREKAKKDRERKAAADKALRDALSCNGEGEEYVREQQKRDLQVEEAGNKLKYASDVTEIIATTVGTEVVVGTVMLPLGGPLATLARKGGQLVKVGGTWMIKHGDNVIPFSQLDDATREAAEAMAKNLDCPGSDIAKKINQFRKKSLRDQRDVYNKLKKTYDDHLKKYGQTPGETLGETFRMERELQHMQEILGGRGQAFDPSGVLQ